MKRAVIALALCLALVGCDAVAESAQSLRDRLADIDLAQSLEGLRDCDRLSDTFVSVVGSAADALDSLSERTGGRVPETDVRNAVDTIAVSQYYDIAERIGCARLQQRLALLDQLQGLDTQSPAGEDFVEEILRQVEATQ